MPNFSRISDEELIEWMTNFISVATTTPAKYGVTTAQITEMSGAKNDLQAKMTARVAAEDAAKSAVAAQKASREAGEPLCSYLNKIVKANPAISDADKIAVGIDPDKPASHNAPVTPVDLVVNGYEDNRNVLKWNRAGNKPNTQFIVEYREAADAEFRYRATTTETVYEDMGVTPGVQCAYRVKAQRSGEQSMYSNVAVVYMQA